MSVYAIGDLHFSGLPPAKPMEIFGENWCGHREKIITAWQKTVQTADTIILCGDTSWGMSIGEALPDLEALCELPGQKVILRGNHDYWWSTVTKITKATQGNLFFLQNNFYPVDNIAICGTRGWNLPSAEGFTPDDETIYNRELLRFRTSLQAAKTAGFTNFIAALHYPALYTQDENSGFTALCEEYQVKTCIFGHIHGQDTQMVFQGKKNGTDYKLVSADYLKFQLLKL